MISISLSEKPDKVARKGKGREKRIRSSVAGFQGESSDSCYLKTLFLRRLAPHTTWYEDVNGTQAGGAWFQLQGNLAE